MVEQSTAACHSLAAEAEAEAQLVGRFKLRGQAVAKPRAGAHVRALSAAF